MVTVSQHYHGYNGVFEYSMQHTPLKEVTFCHVLGSENMFPIIKGLC